MIRPFDDDPRFRGALSAIRGTMNRSGRMRPPLGRRRSFALAIALATMSVGCVVDPPPPALPPRFQVEPWPEADLLFRNDPHWVGGDGAYSIDLGNDRVLWLFGDTYIDAAGRGTRRSGNVAMIGNSIAIQEGRDPSEASIEFHWWTRVDGKPSAFFPDVEGDRYWPGNGIRLGSSLLLFLMRVKAVPEGLGFVVKEWDAVMISNPDDPPASWRIRRLETPDDGRGIIVGSAGVFVDGDWLYAFGSKEPGGQRIHLARFPLAAASDGKLLELQWWTRDGGFVPEGPDVEPMALMVDGQSEFTVHRDAECGRLLLFQTVGFGGSDVAMRSALEPTGPWFPPEIVFRPPERRRERILIYQGKAHPELVGADLVLTYCTNHLDFATAVADETLYFPRFLKASRAR